MRLPAIKRKVHKILCWGGPWDGMVACFPLQSPDDPLSLPVRVGQFVGRYNLNNGMWVPHGQQ